MKSLSVMVAAIVLISCSPNRPEATAQKPVEPEPLRATRWTPKGELYLEYPALVLNQRGRFAIHLTRLGDFKAVKDAVCEVRLRRDVGPEVFPCDLSTHPGIFGANVEPKA